MRPRDVMLLLAGAMTAARAIHAQQKTMPVTASLMADRLARPRGSWWLSGWG